MYPLLLSQAFQCCSSQIVPTVISQPCSSMSQTHRRVLPSRSDLPGQCQFREPRVVHLLSVPAAQVSHRKCIPCVATSGCGDTVSSGPRQQPTPPCALLVSGGGATFQADRTDLMKGEWQDGVRITFVKTPANKRLPSAGAKTVCAKGRDVCVCVMLDS